MGKYFSTKKKELKKYLNSHDKARVVLEYLIALFATLISAFLCSFAYKAFLSPSNQNILTLIAGGVSGLARTIALIFEMCGVKSSSNDLVYSISYFIINIPLLYIAFRYVGTRFAIFSALNVALVSIFTGFVIEKLPFVDKLATNIACLIKVDEGGAISYYQAGILPRVLIAALFNGVSTSLAFAAGVSAGGSDILSFYFSSRKSTNVGKYVLAINTSVMVLFSSLYLCKECVTNHGYDSEYLADAVLILIFAIVYSLILALVIDFINRRNKKEQIQIITKEENLCKFLLANIHHGATIVRAKGAFTGEDRIIIYMVVSIYETKNIITLIREADPKCWINVTSVKQVYGRFFIRPTK